VPAGPAPALSLVFFHSWAPWLYHLGNDNKKKMPAVAVSHGLLMKTALAVVRHARRRVLL